MAEDSGFQKKYNEPLPNAKVEELAATLCVHSNVFIRSRNAWSKVPLDAKHQFREYACELADILGVDGFDLGIQGENGAYIGFDGGDRGDHG